MTIQISLPQNDMKKLINALIVATVCLEFHNDEESVIIDWLGRELTYRYIKKTGEYPFKFSDNKTKS